MKNNWSENEAKKYIKKYKKLGHSEDMALRVYTTRLLGRNPELVLHGGGNTSVKTKIKDIDGKYYDVLCVKGSGWDMAEIEPAGLPAVKLNPLLVVAIYILLFFHFTSSAFGNEDEGTLFLKEVEKLNSYEHNQRYVAKGVSSYSYLRYTKEKEELERFNNIVTNPISNNKRAINKWSKGTFHLIEKKNYGNTYKDYNVYFGNASVVFKENNFGVEESVYILTQIPNNTFNCIDGVPVGKSWNDTSWYEDPGMVKINELENENFYVFPYFDCLIFRLIATDAMPLYWGDNP